MKIDLDDLERAVRAAKDKPGAAVWLDPYSPTLALVARIRELEVLAKDYADCYEGEGYPREAAEVRAVLEKGAVLP